MGRDATHEDEKRKRHRFKRVPTRNGEAGALMYLDLASRFSLWGKTAEKLKGYVSEYLHMVKIHRNEHMKCSEITTESFLRKDEADEY